MDGENLFRKMNSADQRAQYDHNAKKLLAEKVILAHILIHTVPEFKAMDAQSVIPLIEGTPQVAQVPVEPGETNMPEIVGSNTEDAVAYEGTVTYDVRFYVWVPDRSEKMKLIVDVEAQKAFNPGYDLVTRGIFYNARMISAQLGTEFVKSDYNSIKKVYSIWICMNTPKYAENTITRFHMAQENVVGALPKNKFRFDIANVILVCLSKTLVQETDALKLHRMLGILLSKEMPVAERKELFKKEFDITMTEEMERRSSEMCNLSEAILEQGIEQGTKITLIALYRDGCIDYDTLVKRINMSEKELAKLLASEAS